MDLRLFGCSPEQDMVVCIMLTTPRSALTSHHGHSYTRVPSYMHPADPAGINCRQQQPQHQQQHWHDQWQQRQQWQQQHAA